MSAEFIVEWYAQLLRALELAKPVSSEANYRFHFRSRSNPLTNSQRIARFLEIQRANWESAGAYKREMLAWFESNWQKVETAYTLAEFDIPVLKDFASCKQPMRPTPLALHVLRRDLDWTENRLYLCERAIEERLDSTELELRFQENDSERPISLEESDELLRILEGERSLLLRWVKGTTVHDGAGNATGPLTESPVSDIQLEAETPVQPEFVPLALLKPYFPVDASTVQRWKDELLDCQKEKRGNRWFVDYDAFRLVALGHGWDKLPQQKHELGKPKR